MSSSRYGDLSRPPLREPALTRALVVPGGVWQRIRVVAETGSTNADAAAAARRGSAAGLVIVAESQTAGRGRLDRRWEAPPQSSIMVSVVLQPDVAPARWGWLPLLAGVAVAEAVGRVGVVEARLKWPNDVLLRSAAASDDPPDDAPDGGAGAGALGSVEPAGFGKGAGILAEVVPEVSAVVLGIGLNVSQQLAELPPPVAGGLPPTSLAVVGAVSTDRDPLLRAILRGLAAWYGRWLDAAGDPDDCGVRGAYRELCVTLGTQVAVSLPGGEVVTGRALDVDPDGRLIVEGIAGTRALAAGDVRQVR